MKLTKITREEPYYSYSPFFKKYNNILFLQPNYSDLLNNEKKKKIPNHIFLYFYLYLSNRNKPNREFKPKKSNKNNITAIKKWDITLT